MWSHFQYTSGSNPYIATTETRAKEIITKYLRKGVNVELIATQNNTNYYLIDDDKKIPKCSNCKNRYYDFFGTQEMCILYELTANEAKTAMYCGDYEEGDPCPSSTAGDYGPGNPWDAPGMSIRDFI